MISEPKLDQAVLGLPAFNASKFQVIGDATYAMRLHVLNEAELRADQLLHEGSLVTTISVKVQQNVLALRTPFSHLQLIHR